MKITTTDLGGIMVLLVGVVALALPMLKTARESANLDLMKSNGRLIHMIFYADSNTPDYATELDNINRYRYLRAADFASSTALFSNMVIRGFIAPKFDLFSGAGVPTCNSTNAMDFTSENNAWNVVADQYSLTSDNIPAFFTRNLGITNLTESIYPHFLNAYPFKKEKCVVVTLGGAAFEVKRDSPIHWVTNGHTNFVLRP